jgi:hypothetical protein
MFSNLELLRNIVSKYLGKASITENVLSADIKKMSFRKEWQFVVNKLVSETQNEMRAMLFDIEINKWWHSIEGQNYMLINLELIKKGVIIKRIFILSSTDAKVRMETLLTAYVHYKLGVDVRVCNNTDLREMLPFEADMFSVHDNIFIAMYHFASEPAIVETILDGRYISDFILFYDELFNDDRVCRKINEMIKCFECDRSFFESAKTQLALLKRLNRSILHEIENN